MLFRSNSEHTLLVGNEIIRGINILEHLHDAKHDSDQARELFDEAASIHQRTRVPRIGFNLHEATAVMPTKHITDVGYDLTAVAVAKQLTELTTLYETHVSVTIPLGYYAEIAPRSSLSKSGYMLANSIGIIDPGYTGTLKIALIKIDPSTSKLKLPARVCQLILKAYVVSEMYDSTNDLKIATKRGNAGFGAATGMYAQPQSKLEHFE